MYGPCHCTAVPALTGWTTWTGVLELLEEHKGDKRAQRFFCADNREEQQRLEEEAWGRMIAAERRERQGQAAL